MRNALTRTVPHSAVLLPVAMLLLAVSTSDIGLTATTFKGLALLPTFVGVSLSAAAMWNRGQLNRAAHRALGIDASAIDMARVTTVAFAANKVVKSGGAIGLGLFIRHGRRRGHAADQVMSACVLSAAGSLAALGVIVASTFTLLASFGRLNGVWTWAAGVFACYLLAIAGVGLAAVRRPGLIARPLGLALRAKNRVLRSRRRTESTRDHAATIADQIHRLRDTIFTARSVYWYAVESKLYGAAMLLAATAAVGHGLDPVTALIVYTTILLTSLVAFVPGGVGVVEASGAAVLVSVGLPLPAAVLAVTLFRIFDMWIPVVSGFLLGREELRSARAERREPVAIPLRAPLAVAPAVVGQG